MKPKANFNEPKRKKAFYEQTRQSDANKHYMECFQEW